MSLESKSKALVALYKKQDRLSKQLTKVQAEIITQKQSLTEDFTGIGLSSNFSR